MELHPCFGLEVLGMCKYDPQSPTPSYFTIGDAVAALAFTLAVQQFLKPLYEFRLKGFGIKFSYVVLAVFIGAVFTVFAAIVPSIPLVRGTMFGYPLVWEIAGGLIIGGSYAVVAVIGLKSVSINDRNIERLANAAAELLGEATDDDRLSFAKDILDNRNLVVLVRLAAEIDSAKRQAIDMEFERLKARNLEIVVRGQPPISAFYAFAKRHKLQLAHYAYWLLGLLSDPDFCRVVITRHAWGLLKALDPIIQNNMEARAAKRFIQSVAWQALVNEDSIIARENKYSGFGLSRDFARDFFGNRFIIREFEPLDGVYSIENAYLDKRFVSRLNMVSEFILRVEFDDLNFWAARSTLHIRDIYEKISRNVMSERTSAHVPEYFHELGYGVSKIGQITEEYLEICDSKIHDLLFAKQSDKYRHDAINDIAGVISTSLECISKEFQGPDDVAWIFAMDVFDTVFSRFRNQTEGLSPLQQAVAIKLIHTLQQNMDGFYPTLSRVLIALVGPYESLESERPRTAFVIFKDAVYYELRRIPDMFERDPAKVAERLPVNVIYDHSDRSLIQIYRRGQEVRTLLDDIPCSSVDLFAERHLRRRNIVEDPSS
jgi:hypothetical protein